MSSRNKEMLIDNLTEDGRAQNGRTQFITLKQRHKALIGFLNCRQC